MSLNIIILAAGNGKRMHSALPKVMHKVGGKPMLEHVLISAKKLNPKSINVVINSKIESIKSSFTDYNIKWHNQIEQKGTADAVKTVLPNLGVKEKVLILYADTPLIDSLLLKTFINYMPESDVKVLTVELNNPYGYGRIIREQAEEEIISKIIEETEADEIQKNIKECNTGIVFSDVTNLQNLISEVKNNNSKKEYYLTDIVSIANSKGLLVAPLLSKEFNSLLGVNDKCQLEKTEQIYQNEKRNFFLKQGVTMLDAKSIFFIGDVEIRIRPNCNLEENVGIGNFVEVKSSIIKKNTKANHLTYLGDSEIGENVNVGAGVITCNYDGINKHKTIIKNNVFIGSDSQLIAPIIVEEGVTIAAGSTITENSEKDSLLIARSRQQEKKNWKK